MVTKNTRREASWIKVQGYWGLRVEGARPAIGTPVEAHGVDGWKREVIARVSWHGVDKSGVVSSLCWTGKTLKRLLAEVERWDENNTFSPDYDFNKNPWRKLSAAAPREGGAL